MFSPFMTKVKLLSDTKRKRQSDIERERERERMCVCVRAFVGISFGRSF